MDGYRIRCRLLSVDRILARRILMRCIVAEVYTFQRDLFLMLARSNIDHYIDPSICLVFEYFTK